MGRHGLQHDSEIAVTINNEYIRMKTVTFLSYSSPKIKRNYIKQKDRLFFLVAKRPQFCYIAKSYHIWEGRKEW